MASIYTHIDKNKRDTFVIITSFIVFVGFLGWFFGEYYFEGGGLPLAGFALVISGISSFFSYYYSDKIVLAISKAHEITAADNRYLYNLVENMCIAAGITTIPKIYIINDTATNAFATGRDPKHSVICFTTGIVDALEKRELEGVIAHELSHIGNYDIRLMSIVSILVGTITLIADWITRGMFYRGRRRKSSNRNSNSPIGSILLLIGLLLVILSPIIAILIKLAIGRTREYLADSTAALLTRYPKGLADALKKLAANKEILETANGATAHLYIVNPLRSNGGGVLSHLFSTHPPLEERINRLNNM